MDRQPRVAGEATILPAAGVLAAAVGTAAQQTVGQTAQRSADVGGDRVADAAAVLVEVGIAGAMNTRLDPPVPATESEQVGWRGVAGIATAQQMDEALLLAAVGEIEAVAADGNQLSGEREAEGLGGDAAALDLTGLNPAVAFFDRARLRGKRPPGAAGGWRGPAAWAGYP